MRWKTFAVAFVAATMPLLTAGCGVQPSDYSQRQFKSTSELAKTVEQLAGWNCSETDRDDEAHTADSLAQSGFAFVPCSNGSVSVIASDAERAELAANPGNKLNAGYCRLDGGNWSIWGQQYIVQAAQKAMQGKLTCA